jgi:hypothetical protein
VTFSGIFISARTAGSSQINVLRREFHLSNRHTSRPHLTENTQKISFMLFTKIRAVISSIYTKHVNKKHGQNADVSRCYMLDRRASKF